MRRPPPLGQKPPLAGEGQEGLERAVGAPQPREAVGEHAAREEFAELLLDEPGQAAAVAAVRDFSEPRNRLDSVAQQELKRQRSLPQSKAGPRHHPNRSVW